MFIAYAVIASVTAAMLVLSAAWKFTGHEKAVQVISVRLGVPRRWFPYLGACEVAGAVGLVVGMAVEWIGVAAAVGLVLYFVGAVIAHLRVADFGGVAQPAPLLMLSLVALILRMRS